MSSPDKDPREAFGALWELLTPRLFGYLVNTLRDRALAEDILQATWLKAVETLPRLRQGDANMSGWLFAIARNECRQHWRKTGRETPLDMAEHDSANENNPAGFEEKILIEKIFAFLSENDREILRLRYIADLSTNDIARALGSNAVAARVRIHRALGRARAILKSQLS